MAPQSNQSLKFGPYRLDRDQRLLFRGSEIIPLAPKLYDTLWALAEGGGRVVDKEDLLRRVWQDAFVEEGSLARNVSTLRKILGEGPRDHKYIVTVPKRGYRFAATVAICRALDGEGPDADSIRSGPAPDQPSPGEESEKAPFYDSHPASEQQRQENPSFIETRARRSYRLIAPVPASEVAIPSAAPTERNGNAVEESTRVVGAAANSRNNKRFLTGRGVLLAGAALIGALILGIVLYRSQGKAVKQPAIQSLAVLPMKNLSGDSRQEYLADGITEELIGRLAGIHNLRVISRTSVMQFKETKLSAPEIAKVLHVDALVEGSVMREGGKIRVHAQLIRAATDEHFWSETYDREIPDVVALEGDVARAISEKVNVTVSGREHAALLSARQVSPEAYERYLKGRFTQRNTRAQLEESIVSFEDAIEKDPGFAPAYVGLARTYYDMGTIMGGAPPGETRSRRLAALRRALELDPNSAEAHALLAETYQELWQWANAEKEYERALDLQPNDAAAHMGFAKWLAARGQMEEAIAYARRGRILDPLGVAAVESGWVLFCARRYDEAIREMREILSLRPDLGKARWYLGFALIGKGQPEQAVVELEKTAEMTQRSPGSLEVLAAAYGYSGRRQDALRTINELKLRREKGYVPAGAFINPYLGLCDYEQALAGFEQAYPEQSAILQWVKVQPMFDPLRRNPRFQDLVRRVGLE